MCLAEKMIDVIFIQIGQDGAMSVQIGLSPFRRSCYIYEPSVAQECFPLEEKSKRGKKVNITKMRNESFVGHNSLLMMMAGSKLRPEKMDESHPLIW